MRAFINMLVCLVDFQDGVSSHDVLPLDCLISHFSTRLFRVKWSTQIPRTKQPTATEKNCRFKESEARFQQSIRSIFGLDRMKARYSCRSTIWSRAWPQDNPRPFLMTSLHRTIVGLASVDLRLDASNLYTPTILKAGVPHGLGFGKVFATVLPVHGPILRKAGQCKALVNIL